MIRSNSMTLKQRM